MNEKDIEKLSEELNEILNEEVLNEMSKAFSYKNRSIEVCAWVEGPMGVDNRYFKYYNSSYYNTANKVARIKIYEPKYVGGNHKEHNLRKWVLNNRDKEELIEILKSPSDEYDGLIKWQDILITYNKDNFNIPAKNTITGNIENYQGNPKLQKYIKPFPIDYPMPNYLELE